MPTPPGYIAVHGEDGRLLRDHYGAVLLFRSRDDADRLIASDGAYLNYQPQPLVRWIRPRTTPKRS
jgi:hypothetical protein